MEAKYQKLIASTLMALRLFIETVPTSEQESLSQQYRSILGNAKLWKMAKHSSELVDIYTVFNRFSEHALISVHPHFYNQISPMFDS